MERVLLIDIYFIVKSKWWSHSYGNLDQTRS